MKMCIDRFSYLCSLHFNGGASDFKLLLRPNPEKKPMSLKTHKLIEESLMSKLFTMP